MISKWDDRYRELSVGDAEAPAVLRQHMDLLAPPGLALDLACGLGASALWLARAGYRVDAWDLSPVAVQKLREHAQRHGLAIHASVRDVVAEPPPSSGWDLIIVARFLDRRICGAIADALRPGGLLFYQTFCGDGPGPANPAFRLTPGELPQLFAPLDTLVYVEESATGEAQLVARRPAGERA